VIAAIVFIALGTIDRSPSTVLVVRISSVALASYGTKLDEGGGKRRCGIAEAMITVKIS
jgi:hypothetical protein